MIYNPDFVRLIQDCEYQLRLAEERKEFQYKRIVLTAKQKRDLAADVAFWQKQIDKARKAQQAAVDAVQKIINAIDTQDI